MAEQKYNFHRRLNELSDFFDFFFRVDFSSPCMKLQQNHFSCFFCALGFFFVASHRTTDSHLNVSIVSGVARQANMHAEKNDARCTVRSSPN